jgi:hypothetical protein
MATYWLATHSVHFLTIPFHFELTTLGSLDSTFLAEMVCSVFVSLEQVALVLP